MFTSIASLVPSNDFQAKRPEVQRFFGTEEDYELTLALFGDLDEREQAEMIEALEEASTPEAKARVARDFFVVGQHHTDVRAHAQTHVRALAS
jgi:hypothetical protein